MKRAWNKANPEAKAAANRAWVVANQELKNAQGKAWKKANPERMRAYHLRKYGLTVEAFDAMLAAQENRCAICEQVFSGKGPCIDHCHDRKHIRALLCVQCNAALGQFRERPETMEAAARYIRKHNGVLR